MNNSEKTMDKLSVKTEALYTLEARSTAVLQTLGTTVRLALS